MNLIRNPFNVGSPWWYYIEGALTVNVMTFMILIFMFMSYQRKGNVCVSIWILFVIHVVMAFLLWIMALKHDMEEHPEMFGEVTQWK